MRIIAILTLLTLTACTASTPAAVVKKGDKVFTRQNPYGIDINQNPSTTEIVGQSTQKTILKEDGYLVSKETRITQSTTQEDGYLKQVQAQHADPIKDPHDKLKPLDKQVVNNDGTTTIEHAPESNRPITHEPQQHQAQNPSTTDAAQNHASSNTPQEEAADLSDLTANVKDPNQSSAEAIAGATASGGGYLLSSPRGLTNFKWPLEGNVTSRFGKNGSKFNDGINIAAPAGTKVAAAGKGKVIYVGNSVEGYGNLVIVKHDGDIMTAYSHLKEVSVARGAKVNLGDRIGTVGQSGSVESPQLHFSMRIGKKTVNPEATS